MEIKFNCRKCGSGLYFTRRVGPHLGIYCADCEAWERWLGKEEREMVKETSGYEDAARSIFTDAD
jgi:hypothetical protein